MNSSKPGSLSSFPQDYILRQASLQDAESIWNIMNTCSNAMEQKEHFICDDLEYVRQVLTSTGFAVVACDFQGNIVGNLLVTYPGLHPENLGYDVFPEYFSTPSGGCLEDELKKVVHMDSASVLPAHRGHHLERRMIAFAEELLDFSRYTYSFATVAPKNTASLKSLESAGYVTMVTKEKYGGVLRCVMMKKLVPNRI